MGSVARSTVEGAIDAAKGVAVSAEDAASAAATGAVEAARDIGGAAVDTVTKAVSGTISGVTVVIKAPFKKEQE